MKRLILLLCLASASTAGDPPELKSKDGRFKLSLVEVIQYGAQPDGRSAQVSLDVRLTVLEKDPPAYLMPWQDTPLKSAKTPDGKELINEYAIQSVANTYGGIRAFFDIPFGLKKLASLDLELKLAKVLAWSTIEREKIKKKLSFRVGPFQMVVTPEPNQVVVGLFAADDQKAAAAWEKAVGVNPGWHWILNEVHIVDAKGKKIEHQGGSSQGGGAIGFFTTGPFGGGGAIVYPVTLTVRMPKKVQFEKVKFAFGDVVVPKP